MNKNLDSESQKYHEDFKQTNTKYDTIISKLKQSHQSELDTLNKSHEQHLKEIADKHKDELNLQKSEHEKHLDSASNDLREQISQIESTHRSSQLKSIQDYKEQIELLTKTHESTLSQLKDEISLQENEIKRLHSKIHEKDTELESKNFEVDGLMIEIKAKQNVIDKEKSRVTEMKEMLDQIKSQKYQTEENSNKKVMESQERVSELNSNISDLKIHLELETSKFGKEKRALENEIKALKRQNDNDKYQHEARIKEIKSELEVAGSDNISKIQQNHNQKIRKLDLQNQSALCIEYMICKLEAKESINRYKEKYERKLESINKIMNLVEKEINNYRFDPRYYNHEKVYDVLYKSIENATSGDISDMVGNLLSTIKNNAPKQKSFNRSLKETKNHKPIIYKSPLSVSSKFQDSISRDSIISNVSSINDETMMTDVMDFADQTKVEIYQTVDDLIKIVEAQEFIQTNKAIFQHNKYITPERQSRRGLDQIDTVSIKLNPLSGSSNPFSKYDSEDDIQSHIPLSTNLNPFEFESNMRSILFPENDGFLSNIDQNLISKIHSNCKSQL